ncbi:hypothetical protein ACFL5O_10355 [Myxococcota bacterium]
MPAETQSELPVIVQGSVVTSSARVLFSRPLLAVYSALALAVVVEWIPGLERARLLGPRPVGSEQALPMPASELSVGEARIENETRQRAELALPEHVEQRRSVRGPLATRGEEPERPVEKAPPISITDRGFQGLGGFYRSLEGTERREAGAITRIIHFGDSIVASDYVSGTLRRRLQDRFGDAGHGFSLIANAWPAYFHHDVYRFASSGWLVSRLVGPLAPDAIYGLGGVSFRAPAGARARFGTARSGRYGRAVSRFEIAYYRQPEGGALQVNLDGKPYLTLDTAGTPATIAYETIRVPEGEHELELVTARGSVRAFGVAMERDHPRVVLDAIGIQGARARFLGQQNRTSFQAQLRWRIPNLIVYQFGANESADGFAYPMQDYYRTLLEVLLQGKQAVPDAGCLVMGAMDRAARREGRLVTVAVVPALVEEQRKASAEVGCGFFNTFKAMGGHGSMASWVRRGLGQADLTHPTGSGSEVLARWVYRALMEGYEAYRTHRSETPPQPDQSLGRLPDRPPSQQGSTDSTPLVDAAQ